VVHPILLILHGLDITRKRIKTEQKNDDDPSSKETKLTIKAATSGTDPPFDDETSSFFFQTKSFSVGIWDWYSIVPKIFYLREEDRFCDLFMIFVISL
jgi:hypothetical protein